MARGLEFDYDKAIDKATRVFWKKGYSGASLRDLLKAIGIGEGSFYNTLKSKKQLYLECLKYYNETVGRRRAEALFSSASAKEGVRGFFKKMLDDLDDPRIPRVCFVAGSVSSDVLAERDLQKFVQTGIAAFAGAFSDRLKSAKDTGELPPQFEAEVVAQIIATYMQGLYRTVLLSYDRSQVERQINQFLTSLGL
ncbi:MAG TPA: TetR/AcrR family transcriptional regulator [Candidatus Saccharimonadales bacterium]|jgi:TetR/AcrR family transcriptional repressor of nem operon|nr:TetR/AcrR family transcriptional regulator [Candidatus Saccharimonadales bacterium]